MPKERSDMGQILERTRAQLGMLVTQFLLGIAVNLIGDPSGGIAKTGQTILLLLHVFVAIGLLVGGILTLRIGDRLADPYARLARGGGVSVGLAVVAGILYVGLHSDWWSLVMAVAFITAFVSYGALYVKARVATAGGKP